ncbi:MAG: LysR family transcriptional regulator [Rhizobiaceae bacterium]
MNIEHVRTFLAIAETGSFVAAAERLHVTQSTVSARIRALEQQLGSTLFIRNKTGATPTAAGTRFLGPAGQMVRAYEHARQDIGLPKRIRSRLTIAARIGLWDGLLLAWFPRLRQSHPDIVFRAEIGFEPEIMQGLIEGRVDIACLYTPQHRPGLELIGLFVDHLVMVSGAPGLSATDESYIHVDWAPEFQAQFAAMFPEMPSPALSVNIGWLGLQSLLLSGGTGYFPYRLVEAGLAAGKLHLVPGAPRFELPAWGLVRRDRDRSLVDPMIDSLIAESAAVDANPPLSR